MPIPADIPFPSPVFPVDIPFPSPVFPVEDIIPASASPSAPDMLYSNGMSPTPTPPPSPISASDGHGHSPAPPPPAPDMLYSNGMSPTPTPPPSSAASTIDSLMIYHSDSASDSGYESSSFVMSMASQPPPYTASASIPPSYTSMPSYESTQIIHGSLVYALTNTVDLTVKNCRISLRNGRVLPAYRMTGFLVSSQKIEINNTLELFLEGEASISVATGVVKMMYRFEWDSALVALDIISAGGRRMLLLVPRYVVERDFQCRFSELWQLSPPTQVSPIPTLLNALCLTTPSILDGQPVSLSTYTPDANSPAWRAITALASDPVCYYCGRKATVDGAGPVLHQGQWICRKRVYQRGSSCAQLPLSLRLSRLVSTLIGDSIVVWAQSARQRLWPSSPISVPASSRSDAPP